MAPSALTFFVVVVVGVVVDRSDGRSVALVAGFYNRNRPNTFLLSGRRNTLR